MPIIVLIALMTQAASAEETTRPARESIVEAAPDVANFDLSDMPTNPPPDDDPDIVVRADVDRYRLKERFDPRFEEDGKAEFGLDGDVRGAIETEAVEISPGVVSNRLMFRIKLPF